MVNNFDEAFQVLNEIEDDFYGKNNTKWNSYKKLGHWFVSNQSWPVMVSKIVLQVPGLQLLPPINPKLWKGQLKEKDWGTIAGPLIGWFFSPVYRAPIEADVLYSFKYLVGLYFNQQVVIKSGTSTEAYKALSREIENLCWLNDNLEKGSSMVSVPELIKAEANFKYPYFVQELVAGQALYKIFNPVKRRLMKSNYLTILEQVLLFCWELYYSYGIQMNKVSVVYPKLFNLKEDKYKELIKAVEDYSSEMAGLLNYYISLLEKDLRLPCSLIHNDLSAENIIVDKNMIWLIDWGNAKLAPIVEDQVKLISLSGNNHIFSKRVMEKLEQANLETAYTINEQRLLCQFNLLLELTDTKQRIKKGNYQSKRALSGYPIEKRINEEMFKLNQLL